MPHSCDKHPTIPFPFSRTLMEIRDVMTRTIEALEDMGIHEDTDVLVERYMKMGKLFEVPQLLTKREQWYLDNMVLN